ncbi:hypothetical protein XELAEV_18030560mg [Xenopus laevis]|uniref:Uncharacterized protein n=1 Tax=Xenopus laevis TaxID=8355 RepID=A0A974CMI1_XENLA|nr:hypothetical protein XELAEV_18030560mg [Xenopus laevis]
MSRDDSMETIMEIYNMGANGDFLFKVIKDENYIKLKNICTASINGQNTSFSLLCRDPEHKWKSKVNDVPNNSAVPKKYIFTQEGDAGNNQGHGIKFKETGHGQLVVYDEDVAKREATSLSLPEIELVILDDGSGFIIKTSDYEPQLSSLFYVSKTTVKPKSRGNLLGRLLCIECIFNF